MAGDNQQVILRRKTAPDLWTVSEGQYEGRRIFTRFNDGARRLARRGDLTIQIGVAVPFIHPRDDGMPPTEEQPALEEIEDAVKELMGDRGVLVGVITTGGMREFVAYAAEGDWIPAFHEALKERMISHQIQVMAQTDPEWRVYKSFVR